MAAISANTSALPTGRRRCRPASAQGTRRAAGDAPHQQHRQKALPGVVKDAAARDARHVAAQAHQEGAHTLALQVEALHDVVEHEGDAGHVADILQKVEHQVHAHDKARHRQRKGQHVGDDDIDHLGQGFQTPRPVSSCSSGPLMAAGMRNAPRHNRPGDHHGRQQRGQDQRQCHPFAGLGPQRRAVEFGELRRGGGLLHRARQQGVNELILVFAEVIKVASCSSSARMACFSCV